MIHVCSLSRVEALVAQHGIGHLVTLINHETMVTTPPPIPPERHLRLMVNDIAAPMDGMVLPARDHVATLIDFAVNWDRGAPMLIHCWAGISRSTAAAYVSLCARNPHADEADIARRLRAASPTATPNPLIVSLADDILGREGRMVAAISAIGRGEMAAEGIPFGLSASL